MSGLQLGDSSIPETDPKPDNHVTWGGPGPSSDHQNPSAQHPLSSTPTRPLPEPQNDLSVSGTASSEQLGSTIHTAHGSTTSVQGFDSASIIFHGDASSSVPAVQPTGPNVSESVTNSDVVQDSPRDEDVAMDTTHKDAYTQHVDGNRSVVQPESKNLSSMDADQAVQLMDQLFQAQHAGNLADVTSQLHEPQAQQLMQILQLAQAVGQPTGAGQGNSSAGWTLQRIPRPILPAHRVVIPRVSPLMHPNKEDALRQAVAVLPLLRLNKCSKKAVRTLSLSTSI